MKIFEWIIKGMVGLEVILIGYISVFGIPQPHWTHTLGMRNGVLICLWVVYDLFFKKEEKEMVKE